MMSQPTWEDDAHTKEIEELEDKIEELEILVEHLKNRSVPRGHVIINQGDPKADAFFMVRTGRCTVWQKKGMKNY